LGKNGNWSGETIGISKDKKPVMQYISLTSLPDGGMVCVCRDNSKAINANRLQYLMSNLGKGILVEDENHCVVLVNRQFCNLFHIPVQPHEMIGVNCLDSLQQSLALFKDAEKVKTDIFSMMGKQEPLIGQEVVFNDGRILERDYVTHHHREYFQRAALELYGCYTKQAITKKPCGCEKQGHCFRKSKVCLPLQHEP